MLRLYDYLESGNGYKVRLLLTQLERPFERVELDVATGETRAPEFLAKNPNGKIPVLVLEDGTCLAESNAILWYLAEDAGAVPADPVDRARVLQWMFFEQYSHEPNIAVVRFWAFKGEADQHPSEVEDKRARGHAALRVMEDHLAQSAFFVGHRYTIADVALYAYTHVAGEGGFDLALYPRVRAWLARVAAQPRHVPITFDDWD